MQVVADAQDLVERVHPFGEVPRWHIVNPPQELERFHHGDIPPKLRHLPEHDPNGSYILCSLLPGHEAVGANLTGTRYEDAGQHLDRRGFSRAVRPDIADHLSRLDVEGDPGHRLQGLILTMKQINDAAPNSFPAAECAEVLGKVA